MNVDRGLVVAGISELAAGLAVSKDASGQPPPESKEPPARCTAATLGGNSRATGNSSRPRQIARIADAVWSLDRVPSIAAMIESLTIAA